MDFIWIVFIIFMVYKAYKESLQKQQEAKRRKTAVFKDEDFEEKQQMPWDLETWPQEVSQHTKKPISEKVNKYQKELMRIKKEEQFSENLSIEPEIIDQEEKRYKRAIFRFEGHNMAKAVVMSEIIQPPLAKRSKNR